LDDFLRPGSRRSRRNEGGRGGTVTSFGGGGIPIFAVCGDDGTVPMVLEMAGGVPTSVRERGISRRPFVGREARPGRRAWHGSTMRGFFVVTIRTKSRSFAPRPMRGFAHCGAGPQAGVGEFDIIARTAGAGLSILYQETAYFCLAESRGGTGHRGTTPRFCRLTRRGRCGKGAHTNGPGA